MRKSFLTAFLFFLLSATYAQKLFTYGKYSVDAKEFLRAFEKNNSIAPATDRSKAIRDYLELYIKSKLKVREAYARRYDTIPALISEVENLRLQIIDNYMADPQAVEKLAMEAFHRGQKDIHVAHVFISFNTTNGVIDTAAANKKRDEIVKRLAAGEDFMKLASELSDDPSAKTNKGDLGFVTVFTLPYFFENIIYNTQPGKYSGPFRSKSGYHFFKNIEERKAIGKLKAQQILLSYPPGTTDDEKKVLKDRIDSLYERIKAGDDFSKLAVRFSNDYVSASANGNMQAFGIGQYDPEFEKNAFALKKDGDVSLPFETAHGFHILKRINALPAVKDSSDKISWAELKTAVNNPERTAASQKIMFEKIRKQAGFKSFPYDVKILQAYTDSILDKKRIGIGAQQNKNASLFKIGDSTFRVADWIGYAQVFRFNNAGVLKPHNELMEEFIQSNVMLYYREHLEKYNEDFRNQMSEFRDGNLFFEIMQREIWNNAQTDTVALKNYYTKNKAKYNWKESADAIVFFCADEATALEAAEKIKKNPADWQNIVSSYEEKVLPDSSRVELENIPSKNKTTLTAGMVTAPLVNNDDKSASFAYIIKIYNSTSPRSFAEAKGLVINDYQNVMEEKWVAQLRKKYPVVINQKVLATLK